MNDKTQVIPMDTPETINQILMRRYGLSADELAKYAKECVADEKNPEGVCLKEFGPEPD